MSLVFDTGPLFAALDADDAHHRRCADLLSTHTEQRVIPAPVLPELAYWIAQRLRSEHLVALLEDVRAGVYRIEDLQASDYDRVIDICRTYRDTPVGFVDAAVLAIVERLNEPKLATLDHRHFRMMRPRHVESLALLPE